MKYLEMFDKIENEDYIIEDISNNIEDDENSDSNSEEEDESKDEEEKNNDKKDDSDEDNDISSDGNFTGNKENKIIYPKNENNDNSKNKNNNNKGNNKNKTKYNCSNELVSKFKFNLIKLLGKKKYNDMIKEQKKIFGNMEVEIKPIHLYKREKKVLIIMENI